MPYVTVPRDLSKVRTKVAFNLTKRQLICFGGAAAIGLPTYFLAKGVIGNTPAVLVMIAVMLPGFFFGMYEKNGQPAEKIVRNFLRTRLWPKNRIYQTDNLYKRLSNKEELFAQNETTSPAGKAPAKKRPKGKERPRRC